MIPAMLDRDLAITTYGDSYLFYQFLTDLSVKTNGHMFRSWEDPQVYPQRHAEVFLGISADGHSCITGKDGNKVVRYFETPTRQFFTWGQIGRSYLSASFPAGKKLLPLSPEPIDQSAYAPLYFGAQYRTQSTGTFQYIDIRSAYGQLASQLPGPAIRYSRARGGHLGYYPDYLWPESGSRNSFLVTHKHAARAMFGIMSTKTVQQYLRGEFVERQAGLRFYNPDLCMFVKDCLHAIAWEAIEKFGCLRWHTDGGVFPGDQGRLFLAYLRETWDIEARLEIEGYGWLYDLNTFRIGGRQWGKDRGVSDRTIWDEQDAFYLVNNLRTDLNPDHIRSLLFSPEVTSERDPLCATIRETLTLRSETVPIVRTYEEEAFSKPPSSRGRTAEVAPYADKAALAYEADRNVWQRIDLDSNEEALAYESTVRSYVSSRYPGCSADTHVEGHTLRFQFRTRRVVAPRSPQAGKPGRKAKVPATV